MVPAPKQAQTCTDVMLRPRPDPLSSILLRVRAVTHLSALATGCLAIGANTLRLLLLTSRSCSKQHGKQHSQGLVFTHHQFHSETVCAASGN